MHYSSYSWLKRIHCKYAESRRESGNEDEKRGKLSEKGKYRQPLTNTETKLAASQSQPDLGIISHLHIFMYNLRLLKALLHALSLHSPFPFSLSLSVSVHISTKCILSSLPPCPQCNRTLLSQLTDFECTLKDQTYLSWNNLSCEYSGRQQLWLCSPLPCMAVLHDQLITEHGGSRLDTNQCCVYYPIKAQS